MQRIARYNLIRNPGWAGIGFYEGDPQLDGNAQSRNPACAGRGYTWNHGPITTYALTVTETGGNGLITSNPTGITCSATCTAAFNRDAQVTLTATPDTGYRFTGWSGACDNLTGTCTMKMDITKNVTAHFKRVATLSIAKSGSGAGRVTGSNINCGSDCAETYNLNTVVTLTAAAYIPVQPLRLFHGHFLRNGLHQSRQSQYPGTAKKPRLIYGA